MRERVKEMEDEAAKLRAMQAEVEKSMHPEEGKSKLEHRCSARSVLKVMTFYR